ncbi:DUF4355 domain-containing protein [Bacillus pumilus]|uniref:DUF4355 domain-containing protein n=1 Tax=Bacillus pumilus TaxID=1408 RepID=UPI0011A4D377|nr:DUF4355 domain-containing protein [Bacillus pumilus]
MNIEEIKQFLEKNKENEEVKAFVGELSAVSADKVKGFLETEEGKKVLQPRLDQHFTKGLATWKENNLEKIVEDEVSKRNPSKTPEQLEIEKLRKDMESERNARNREKLVNTALKVADKKMLPKDVIDFFIGENEESTIENLGKLEESFNAAVQTAVDAKFKDSGREIERGNGASHSNGVDIAKLASQSSIRK